MRRGPWGAGMCFGLLVTAGLLGGSGPASLAAEQAFVIVQFRDSVTEPAKPEFVDSLSRETGARLTFVRPLSGGAYLFAVEEPAGPAAVDQVVRRLSLRPDVAHAEADRTFQPQGP